MGFVSSGNLEGIAAETRNAVSREILAIREVQPEPRERPTGCV